MPLAVALKTLGCKVNRVESDAVAQQLAGRGVRIVSEDDATVIVINTCTVTGEADAKARKAVRRALSGAHAPVVVVTGCLASLDADGLRAIDPRVVVESDKSLIGQRVDAALASKARESAGQPTAAAPCVSADEAVPRTRALLKVEDGCDSFCSYCIVPYARGIPRSVPLADVLAQAERLVACGVREIVLTGINVGRYSDEGADLATLIGAVAATGVDRLRLSSIEPMDLDESLCAALAATPAVCPHLHVPLQSGSDRVLASMKRSYTARDYETAIARVRAAIPGLTVTTDLIAGFPGESDSDHEATVALVQIIGFSKLHVFRYSERLGTEAAGMEQLPAGVRAKRAAALREVGAQLRAGYIDARLGSDAELLVEQVRDGRAIGTTRDYLRVEAEVGAGGDRPSVGATVPVRLVNRKGERVAGVLLGGPPSRVRAADDPQVVESQVDGGTGRARALGIS